MKVEFNESFLKDLKAVKDKSALAKVKAAIEASEQADTLDQLIIHLKKMRGSRVILPHPHRRLSPWSKARRRYARLYPVPQPQRHLPIFPVTFAAIEKEVVVNATARMTDDCQKGIDKFLEK